MGDILFGAETNHLLASEISYVLEDDSVRDPEAIYCVLLEELEICCSLTSESGNASILLVK